MDSYSDRVENDRRVEQTHTFLHYQSASQSQVFTHWLSGLGFHARRFFSWNRFRKQAHHRRRSQSETSQHPEKSADLQVNNQVSSQEEPESPSNVSQCHENSIEKANISGISTLCHVLPMGHMEATLTKASDKRILNH
jgi:hypothetical protein